MNLMMPKNPNDDEESPEEYKSIESTESIDTGQWEKIHQGHYDREEDGELVTELVFIIGEAKGVDPLDHTEMPPLYQSIDIQVLEETFFGPLGADTIRDEEGTVTFMYDGYKVSLRSDGWIFVYETR